MLLAPLVLQLGGTIGDIEGMPFVEAFRQFQFRASHDNFCNIHVSLVPQVRWWTGRLDTCVTSPGTLVLLAVLSPSAPTFNEILSTLEN